MRSAESVTVTLESTSKLPHVFLHVVVAANDVLQPFKVVGSMGAVDETENIDYFFDLSFSSSSTANASSNRTGSLDTDFYTDSNGHAALRRTYNSNKPVENSVHPIASFVSIPLVNASESGSIVSVLADRATGVTSSKPNTV